MLYCLQSGYEVAFLKAYNNLKEKKKLKHATQTLIFLKLISKKELNNKATGSLTQDDWLPTKTGEKKLKKKKKKKLCVQGLSELLLFL